MKKPGLIKAIAASAALCLTISALSACSDNNNNGESSVTTSAAEDTTSDTEESISVGTMRPVAEGDTYAINKFTVSELPEGYRLASKSQENQGLLFLSDKSQVIVMAANYKEDLQPLEKFADSGCASIKFTNMISQSDTDFSEPEKTTVAGFDAIRYDYDITVNEFIKENESDEGDGVKTPVDWFKSRIYFFYSDKDAFYFTFTTNAEDWDETIGAFEEFTANIVIDENAENEPAESSAASSETSAS